MATNTPISVYAVPSENCRSFQAVWWFQQTTHEQEADDVESYATHVAECVEPDTLVIIDEGDGVRMVY